MKKVKLKKGNRTVCSSVEYIDNAAGRGIGIMFRSKASVVLAVNQDSKAETAIHTFFCKPLIVAWINSKNIVVDVRKTAPFWFYCPKKPAKYVFETTNLNLKLKIGDKIRFTKEK